MRLSIYGRSLKEFQLVSGDLEFRVHYIGLYRSGKENGNYYLGFRVYGLGLRVYGLGCRVYGSTFGVQGFEIRIHGLGLSMRPFPET